jgi:CyaY protein
MTETEFLAAADAALDAIESSIDATGADVDIERSGTVLTLTCADGSRVVVNAQAPMQQIWVAARSGGFHFALREGTWIDTRDGAELFAALSRILSQQGGQAMVLSARR